MSDRPIEPGGLSERADLSDAEQAAMHRALALAETARGRTSPNPAVGAVLLDPAGRPCGEGATEPAGGAHAEIVALRAAGDLARGATAVVTLEPCAHTGRTGPCVDALIAAGVARVVYAVDDPNPEAAGGAARLREAGVDVLAGVDEHAAASGVLRPWLHATRVGRPFVTWKYAATLDGRIAAADGTSQWISSAESRADVHVLRSTVDAVVVGSGTVLADDPRLTARVAAPGADAPEPADPAEKLAAPVDLGPVDAAAVTAHQPLRVVLDRRHRVPPDAQVLDDAAETLVLDVAAPRFALKALYDRGVRHALLEGGPTLAGAFLEAGCVDEVIAYLAPVLLGSGPAALGDAGIGTLVDAVALDVESVTRIGDDVKVVARTRWSEYETARTATVETEA